MYHSAGEAAAWGWREGGRDGDCTLLYCTVLYCTVLHCTVLYCTVLYCKLCEFSELHYTQLWAQCSLSASLYEEAISRLIEAGIVGRRTTWPS